MHNISYQLQDDDQIYVASVTRNLSRGCGDRFTVAPAADEVAQVTDELRQVPPAWDSVAYFRGTFASRQAAYAAVRKAFPRARIG